MMFCMSAVKEGTVRCINPSQVSHIEAVTDQVVCIRMTNTDNIFVFGTVEQIINNLMWATGSTKKYANIEAKYNDLLEGK